MSVVLANLDGLGWLVLMLLPLLILQRLLHREIMLIFYLITRSENITIALYALVFFPGVLLHEVSHFLAAQLLRVRTGGFSVIPRALRDGRLVLGYVEVAHTDWLRDSLIGVAPLVSGALVVSFLMAEKLQLLFLWDLMRTMQWVLLWKAVQLLPTLQDFWLWFYLAFAVGSTMLPSESDRTAWVPLGMSVLVLGALAVLAGAGPWMLANLAPGLNTLLGSVAAIFAATIVIHVVLLPPVFLFRRLLMRAREVI